MLDLSILKNDPFLTSQIGEMAQIMRDESLDIIILDSKNYVKYKVMEQRPKKPQFSDISKGIVVGPMSVLGLLTQYEKTELKNTVFVLSERNHIESVDIKLKEFLQRGATVFIVKPEGEVIMFDEDGTLIMLGKVEATEVSSVTCEDSMSHTMATSDDPNDMVQFKVSVSDFIDQIKTRNLVLMKLVNSQGILPAGKDFNDYSKSDSDDMSCSPLVSEQDIIKHKKITYRDYSIDLHDPEVRMIMVGTSGQVYKLVNPLISIISFIDNVVMCERSQNNNTVNDFIIVTRISYMNNLDVAKALKLHTSESHLSPIVVTDSAPMVTFRTDRTLDYTVLSTEALQDMFIYLTGGTPRNNGAHKNMNHLLFQVLSNMNNMNQHVGVLTETGNLYTTKSQDMCYNRPFGDMNTNEENRPKFVVLANEEAFTRKNIDFISAITAFTDANIRFFKSNITSPHAPMFI